MRVGFDHGEERSIGKLRLRYLRSFLKNVHFADERYHPGQPLAWTIEEHESFMVRDATGQALGYFPF